MGFFNKGLKASPVADIIQAQVGQCEYSTSLEMTGKLRNDLYI